MLVSRLHRSGLSLSSSKIIDLFEVVVLPFCDIWWCIAAPKEYGMLKRCFICMISHVATISLISAMKSISEMT